MANGFFFFSLDRSKKNYPVLTQILVHLPRSLAALILSLFYFFFFPCLETNAKHRVTHKIAWKRDRHSSGWRAMDLVPGAAVFCFYAITPRTGLYMLPAPSSRTLCRACCVNFTTRVLPNAPSQCLGVTTYIAWHMAPHMRLVCVV